MKSLIFVAIVLSALVYLNTGDKNNTVTYSSNYGNNAASTDRYTGVYFTGSGLTITSDDFGTLTECNNWLREVDASTNSNTIARYDFECGRNCDEPRTYDSPIVCEETFDYQP